MNAIISRPPLAPRLRLHAATRGLAGLMKALRRPLDALRRSMAGPRPFPVRNPAPDFVIIHFIGGDNDMTGLVRIHLNQMERGTRRNVAVLAVTDVIDGPARAIEVSAGTRTVLEELGEINTGDSQILANLLARALVSYPPQTRFAIGFADHGSGVFDEPGGKALRQAFLDARLPGGRLANAVSPAKRLLLSRAFELIIDTSNHDMLTNRKAGLMLRDAFAAAGRRERVDLIFSDACLNGMIEVATEIGPFARCTVASEELEPSSGWDYSKWISRTEVAPPADAETWARQAVEAMEETYRDIPEVFPVTLSAIRSNDDIIRAFADMVTVAGQFGQAGFAQLEKAVPNMVFGKRNDSYDLCGFARNLAQGCDIREIATAAGTLLSVAKAAVIQPPLALGNDVADAEGIAFWFPRTRESMEMTGAAYRNLRFEAVTGWLAYLRVHRSDTS